MDSKNETTIWLFGRGLSCSCGLSWTVPADWKNLPRDGQIERIKYAIRTEMGASNVDISCIQRLLDDLAAKTSNGRRHRFGTTNWDYLLQREMLTRSIVDWDGKLPTWLANSHVTHFNGTAEELETNKNRSPFLLEEDAFDVRTWSAEADSFFNFMIWARRFVVVGMSFECDTDRFLLQALGKVEDDLPIGESSWLIINPDAGALKKSCQAIQEHLPHATIKSVCSGFSDWQDDGYPGL
ncbi:hypothetical protein D7I39_11120 [Allopusillimonas ginsengisoli]|nr:hypothetical protein D7I39_11120 [Allopusillimonas ginsengisoli]